MWYKKSKRKIDGSKMTIPKILPLFLLIGLGSKVLDIGGKSIIEFGICFLLGYFVLSFDEVQDRLEKRCVPLAITWVGFMVLRCVAYQLYQMHYISFDVPAVDISWFIIENLFKWIGILAIIGLAKRYLKFHNKVTEDFAKASFPVYLLHQSVIVVVGFFVAKYLSCASFQFVVILVISFVVTMAIYWICKKFTVTRFLLGIKIKKGEN
jgi:peptidoglycan/LPS O-acetylase OafA/YrhL